MAPSLRQTKTHLVERLFSPIRFTGTYRAKQTSSMLLRIGPCRSNYRDATLQTCTLIHTVWLLYRKINIQCTCARVSLVACKRFSQGRESPYFTVPLIVTSYARGTVYEGLLLNVTVAYSCLILKYSLDCPPHESLLLSS